MTVFLVNYGEFATIKSQAVHTSFTKRLAS